MTVYANSRDRGRGDRKEKKGENEEERGKVAQEGN